MNLSMMKDELSILERAIKTRERDIQREIFTVNRFRQKAALLKDHIQMFESGQLELFKQTELNQENTYERYK